MTIRLIALVLFIFLARTSSHSQDTSIKWWDPAESVVQIIEGQAWKKEVKHPFDRLPAKAEKTVRSDVWNLSHHTAGLMIRFRSNADQIIVRYVSGERKAMPHRRVVSIECISHYTIR